MTIEYKDSKRIVALSSDVLNTPTYSDDFTGTDDWADQGSGVGVNTTTDRLEFSSWTDDGTNNSSTLDLGSALSDTKWVIRFKFHFSAYSNTSDNTGPAFGMWANPSSTGGSSAEDSLLLWTLANAGTKITYISSNDNQAIGGTDTNLSYAWVTGTTYYVQLQRDGSSFSATIWTGSYEGTEVASGTNTIDGTNTGLRYFGVKSFMANRGGSWTGWLDDLKIYDGILSTSLTNKPTNVQDNSLLIEKDTANRYWFSPESTDAENITWDNATLDSFTDSSGTITLSSTSGGWLAKAQSSQTFTSSTGGETVINISAPASGAYLTFGLGKNPYAGSTPSGNEERDTVNFAFVAYNNYLHIWELGVDKYTVGTTWSASDDFKITMSSSGEVKYYVNDVLKYTSLTTASGTFYTHVTGARDGSSATVSGTITQVTPATWTYEPNANSSPLFDTHNGTTTSDSTTITVASNDNRLLIAHVGHSSNQGNAATTVTSVTSNVSGAFTQLMTQNSDASANNKTDVWYLKAPATGAHTVTVVYSHSTGSRTIALTSLYNVDQITPINLSSKAGNGSSTGTPITVDITPTVKNSVLMALCQAQYSQNTPSDTSIYMSSYVGGGDFSISAQKKLSPTKDSVNTMSWVKNSNAAWSIVAFEVIGV